MATPTPTPKLISVATTTWGASLTLVALDADGHLWYGTLRLGHPTTWHSVPTRFFVEEAQ